MTNGLHCVLSLEQKFCLLAILRDGEVVWDTQLRAFHGDDIVNYLTTYLYQKHLLLVGESSVERLLMNIGSLMPLHQEQTQRVMARDRVTGQPASIEISSLEIRDSIRFVTTSLVADLKYLLHQEVIEEWRSKSNPEIVRTLRPQVPEAIREEIAEIPIRIIGEYNNLRGLPEYLSQELGRGFFVESEQNS